MRHCFILTLPVVLATGVVVAMEPPLTSPDGKVSAAVMINAEQHLAIEVRHAGRPVLLPSLVGVIVDNRNLGERAVIGKAVAEMIDEKFPWRGVKSEARNNCRQHTLAMTSPAGGAEWKLQVRAYDDGVAWRILVAGEGKHQVSGEPTTFVLPAGTRAWCQSNTANYEGFYAAYTLARSATNPRPDRVGMPVTCELPGGGFALLSEADIMGYSGMSLNLDENGVFRAMFEDDPQGWTMNGPFATPWRVVMVSGDLNGLVNSTLVANLCPPPAPKLFPQGMAEPWIRPGRCLWQWWAYDGPGTEWKQQKWFVDRAAELKCEYYLVDEGWENPKFGWIADGHTSWSRMKELVDYAAKKGVKIWIWKPWQTKPEWFWVGLETPEKRAKLFADCAKIGVVGIKVDFMDSESQDRLEFYRDCLEQSAKNQIMINFHGANKPAGEMRTWPHEMNREGMRGFEYNKWIVTPRAHFATLPFTRMVTGHCDYTPTTFQKENLKQTTCSLQLANAVVLGAPLHCWADKPDVYLSQPERVVTMICEMPTCWDETRVLPGSRIGQLAAFARRAGDEWWVALVNGSDQAMKYRLDPDFLGTGTWQVTTVSDVRRKPDQMDVGQAEWRAGVSVEVACDEGGGFVARMKLKK